MYNHHKIMAAARANFPNMAHFGPDPNIFKPIVHKPVELIPPGCKTEADLHNHLASLPPIEVKPLIPLPNPITTPKIDIPEPFNYIDFLKLSDY